MSELEARRGPLTASAAVHPALQPWEAAGGELRIGGQPVSALARRAGRTPFYAYDRAKIAQRVAHLRNALPPSVHLHYAIKANPMPAVIAELARLVDGVDVASGLELQAALDAGVNPAHVGFAGPGKTDAELTQAIAAGIVIELESVGEMRRAAAIARAQGVRPSVAVRVNPDFRLKGAGMHMAGGPSAFGVDAEAVPDLLAELAGLSLTFVGFHIFAGSQNLNAESLVQAEAAIVDLAIRLAEHAPAPVRHLNIGGGFGVPYFPKDVSLDLAAVGQALHPLAERVAHALPEARLVIELGRYLVAEAGVYLTRVIDRKVSRGQTYLVTDGGLHHHLAATGNFGQGIRRNFPVAVATRFDAPATETVSVVGCLCTPIDLLADKVTLPYAEPGDLIAIFQSGAYGFSASPRDFLSHPQPAQLLV
ncbi:pyridoxal-dependent decarboxylase, exosortase A system-associated [Rhodovibrio salinarum]|uniref:Pyridoxal-dependent decarboxylase, exosortase A system-associated n=1 Tax=Rhodovibrio salinarum TaxID=1087 RepID=A0A934UZ12_9PROT|nr:pyridoxal-dependent decarboxylase, exosortase A system-associated [Rhodovibrio salinarum]MBK1696014.1 pyridoxal-dependent decarboxylase, exosortase A system-associated [Rhodovibrio salinarum]